MKATAVIRTKTCRITMEAKTKSSKAGILTVNSQLKLIALKIMASQLSTKFTLRKVRNITTLMSAIRC